MNTHIDTAAARYDDSMRHAWKSHTPHDCPLPQRTAAWPNENVELLEQYRVWLFGGGTGTGMVDSIYVPVAGYALGLNLKPHPEINLESDFQRVLDYIHAKRLSAISTNNRRNALEKFRKFMRQQRGETEVTFREPNYAYYCAGLPEWLVNQLERYQRLRQRNWRPARQHYQVQRFWSSHTRLWRWLVEQRGIQTLTDVKRQHLLDYADARLAAGYAVRSINSDLRCLHAFLLHLQDQDITIPKALLRMLTLKEPETLPRFLTDEQVRLLRDDLEQRVRVAATASLRRDALLDRAAFYLLWQGALRLGEVEELHLEDLDLAGRKLMVRQGKGLKDRAIYLTNTTVRALQEYLVARGMAATDHVFLFSSIATKR